MSSSSDKEFQRLRPRRWRAKGAVPNLGYAWLIEIGFTAADLCNRRAPVAGHGFRLIPARDAFMTFVKRLNAPRSENRLIAKIKRTIETRLPTIFQRLPSGSPKPKILSMLKTIERAFEDLSFNS